MDCKNNYHSEREGKWYDLRVKLQYALIPLMTKCGHRGKWKLQFTTLVASGCIVVELQRFRLWSEGNAVTLVWDSRWRYLLD